MTEAERDRHDYFLNQAQGLENLAAGLDADNHEYALHLNKIASYYRDVVAMLEKPQVTCKDCKHFNFSKPKIEKPWGLCKKFPGREISHAPQDYCMYAEGRV